MTLHPKFHFKLIFMILHNLSTLWVKLSFCSDILKLAMQTLLLQNNKLPEVSRRTNWKSKFNRKLRKVYLMNSLMCIFRLIRSYSGSWLTSFRYRRRWACKDIFCLHKHFMSSGCQMHPKPNSFKWDTSKKSRCSCQIDDWD